jgi:hypothetical protein
MSPGQSSICSSALVISGKGQDVNTSFRLSGRLNLEVIPGSNLKVDMPSSLVPEDDIHDRHVAKNFMVALDHKLAFNGVLTVAEATILTEAVRGLSFERRELKNFAFLSMVLPILRSVGRYAM